MESSSKIYNDKIITQKCFSFKRLYHYYKILKDTEKKAFPNTFPRLDSMNKK